MFSQVFFFFFVCVFVVAFCLTTFAAQVPSDCIGYITGSRRATLGRMEEEQLG